MTFTSPTSCHTTCSLTTGSHTTISLSKTIGINSTSDITGTTNKQTPSLVLWQVPAMIVTTKPTNSSTTQETLLLIITTVLRKTPHKSSYYTDDCFQYFPGFVNLTAILHINVQLPLLTIILLEKLASNHLWDATRGFKTMQQAVKSIFLPLWQQVNPTMYQQQLSQVDSKLQPLLDTLLSFIVPWIQSWCCSSQTTVIVASQLMDVFLVSHASMPAK